MENYFTNGKIVIDNEVLEGYNLIVSDDKIVDITNKNFFNGGQIIDVGGNYILPGFIDIHVHGGGGADIMDGTPEDIEKVVNAHLLHGTTSICPTTMSAPMDELELAFKNYREVLNRKKVKSNLLGLHLEGPYISPKMCGAQRLDLIVPPTDEIIKKLKDNSDIISRISCAPEVENVNYMAKELLAKGVQFSMGHTNATYEQAEEATKIGFSSITHMYSATSGFHKVDQKVHIGVTQAGYGIDELYVELIGDGCHVPKELLRLVSRFKGADKICLVTDAMRATGTEVTESYLGKIVPENRVIIDDGVAKLPDKSCFAGSIGTMDKAVKFAVEKAKLPIVEVSKMVSLTPARLLKVDDRLGSFSKGKQADLVLMDDNFNVTSVYVKGEKVV